MLRSKQTIIALIAFSTIAFSAPKTFVYILKFENTERDESVDWLAQGFVDMLNAQLTNQQGVVLKNRQDLEVIMDNRSLMLHQPRGSKNLLLLGKFSRSLDNIQINIQLIDVATWEEADRRKISEKYNEIPKLNIKLTEAIQTMLTPFLPKIAPSKYPALLESKPSPMDKSYARSSSEVGIEIDKSLEALEASMDIMAGARGIPIKPNYKKSGGEWSMDITSDPFISGDPDMAENTSMLIGVLDKLMADPYEVTITRPDFIYSEDNIGKITIHLPVNFSIKGNVIKEMLTSLPYFGLKQEGALTVFFFDKDKFNFPGELTKRIKFGKYRAVPVIRFYDNNGAVKVVIVDTPEKVWHTAKSERIHYIVERKFAQLIDFTVGGWSLQVAMEAVNIPVDYSFIIDVDEARNLQRISLKFIPEHELELFLRPYL